MLTWHRRGARAVVTRALAACAALALCSGLAVNGSALGARPVAAASRPNIILITTDDQSVTDMSVMAHVQARLAGRGTTFAHAYSPYPLCCPARATILTGQYAHNNHVFGNQPPYGGFQAFDDSNTLPLWLQSVGYNTAIIGKYLNGYPAAGAPDYVPPGWDTWRVPTQGIYNYRHWTLNENGRQVAYTGQYETNFIGQEASQLVSTLAASTKPYFLWAGFLAPHVGRPHEAGDPTGGFLTPNVAPRYRGTLSGVRLPAKLSIDEADVSDKPAFVRNSPILSRSGLRQVNEQRLESLLSVDDAVNGLLNAVLATGERSKTIIIFTSDNGYLIGEHRRIGKDIGYEEATRVPFIVAGPGFDTGQTRDQKVSLTDIAPTVADEAHATPGLRQDGVSLTKIAADPTTTDHRAILLEGGPTRAEPNRWYSGIHTNRYDYVDYRSTGEKEFYDLKKDPEQLHNLAVLAPGSAEEHKLARALTTLKSCAGPVCREGVAALAR